jgi:hypothetical protein
MFRILDYPQNKSKIDYNVSRKGTNQRRYLKGF